MSARRLPAAVIEHAVMGPNAAEGGSPIAGVDAIGESLTRSEFRPRCPGGNTAPGLSVSRAPLAENKMHAFIRRFLMHYGIYRRYPLGRFPALRNAWRAAQP
jgi:hypothetical protein